MSYSGGFGVTAIEQTSWKDALRLRQPQSVQWKDAVRTVGWKDAMPRDRQWAYAPKPMMGNYVSSPAPQNRYRVYSPDVSIPIRRARFGRYGAIQGLGSVELGLLAVL